MAGATVATRVLSSFRAWAWVVFVAIAACSSEPGAAIGAANGGGLAIAAGNASTSGGAVLSSAAGGGASRSGGGSSSGASTTGGNTTASGSSGVAIGGVGGLGISRGGSMNGGGAMAAGSMGAAAGSSSSSRGGAGNAGSIAAGGATRGGTSATGGGAGKGGGSTVAGGSGLGGMSAAGGLSGAGGGSATPFMPCPATAACVVLPLGDSITEGFGSSGGGYRVELFRQAVQNGRNITFAGNLLNGPTTVLNRTFPRRHEGHGGFTIDSGTGHAGISGQITQQAIATYKPHIVLLMIGTNDINGNIDVANAPKRLGNLVDDITARAPNALVVVATIIPIGNDSANQRVQSYNAAISSLVKSRAAAGKHLVLLDNYAVFSKNANYRTVLMGDYLHPNDAGYVVLGQSFYRAIETVLPSGA